MEGANTKLNSIKIPEQGKTNPGIPEVLSKERPDKGIKIYRRTKKAWWLLGRTIFQTRRRKN